MNNDVSWKESVVSCLDAAQNCSKAFGATFGDFQDVVVNYLCGVKETSEIVDEPVASEVRVSRLSRKNKSYTDRSISGRFSDMVVYICDKDGQMNPKSVATIVSGIDDKSKDGFKLAFSGRVLNTAEYLKMFNYTTTNTAKIRFADNPKVSVWMLKNLHYDTFKNPEDIKKYKRTHTSAR